MKKLRIAGEILGWILVGLLILLSIFAFQGKYFPPAALGADFLTMAMLMMLDTVRSFKKPVSRYRKFVVEYDDGTKESHTGRANAPWKFSTVAGKNVVRINVADFESEKPNE